MHENTRILSFNCSDDRDLIEKVRCFREKFETLYLLLDRCDELERVEQDTMSARDLAHLKAEVVALAAKISQLWDQIAAAEPTTAAGQKAQAAVLDLPG
jgi:hypothetical protein